MMQPSLIAKPHHAAGVGTQITGLHGCGVGVQPLSGTQLPPTGLQVSGLHGGWHFPPGTQLGLQGPEGMQSGPHSMASRISSNMDCRNSRNLRAATISPRSCVLMLPIGRWREKTHG